MGLLDNIFGGNQAGRGGTSPLTLALLALLAYRTYQGKGRLADMLGRTPDGRPPGPATGDRAPGGSREPPGETAGSPRGGGLGNLLGGLFGGAAGRPTGGGGGLGDLLRAVWAACSAAQRPARS
ncbi:hypothetical protein [Bosea massiliensis]|uniref:DUF533 domain-containing protein n=1 Tax=Bosea massiliensis TaxID=151419 RepID=A0ABW0P7T6_9HYPH|nr:MAG: hypothetical protein DI537_32430 [Stutzerimonas stutzeri]